MMPLVTENLTFFFFHAVAQDLSQFTRVIATWHHWQTLTFSSRVDQQFLKILKKQFGSLNLAWIENGTVLISIIHCCLLAARMTFFIVDGKLGLPGWPNYFGIGHFKCFEWRQRWWRFFVSSENTAMKTSNGKNSQIGVASLPECPIPPSSGLMSLLFP